MTRPLAYLPWVLLCLAGCSFHARSAEDYRKVTRELVETRHDAFQTCYEDALRVDAQAAGDVAVAFQMEAETGKLHSPKLVPERTTASNELARCVITAVDGLVLDPPDQRTAQAEFVWSFGKV